MTTSVSDDGGNRSVRGIVMPLAVSGIGLLLAGIELQHTLKMDTIIGRILEAGIPLILALVLVYAGYWLYVTDLAEEHVFRVSLWFFIGVFTMTLVTAWVIVHQMIRGYPFAHTRFVLTSTGIVGGIGGLIVGVYDTRSRARKEAIATERERMAFLNQLLRHHALNRMNLVLGRTASLRSHVAGAGMADLDSIEACGQDIVTLIQRVRTLTEALTDDDCGTHSVSLSKCLDEKVNQLEQLYDRIGVTADIPPDIDVEADHLLGEVFENVLLNAIQHNPSENPHVWVVVETSDTFVTVSITDNGPGIPADMKTRLFDLDPFDFSDKNHGIGLAIVSQLVDRYNGHIQVTDAEESGTTVEISLFRATEDPL